MLTNRSVTDVKMLAFPNQMNDRCPVALFGSPSTPSRPSQRRGPFYFLLTPGRQKAFSCLAARGDGLL